MARAITRRLGLEAAVVALALVGVALMIRMLPLPAGDRSAGWSVQAGEFQVAGTLWPARLGLNRVELALTEAAGQPVADAEVEVAFVPVGGGAVISRRLLTRVDAAGRYHGTGFALSRAGPWQMLVTIRRAGQPNAYASLDWEAGLDQALRTAGDHPTFERNVLNWINQYGATALSLLAGAGVLVWGRRAWGALRPLWGRGG